MRPGSEQRPGEPWERWAAELDRDAEERPRVHYGCLEFRDDSERVIGGRASVALGDRYHAHLACCEGCQRYHHGLEAVYRRPDNPKLVGFAREREFRAILARSHAERDAAAQRARAPAQGRQAWVPGSWVAAGGVGALVVLAAVLVVALVIPSVGVRLFDPLQSTPSAEWVEVGEGESPHYGDGVRIPHGRHMAHQAQRFGRVVGGQGAIFDREGRPSTNDSLREGARLRTQDHSLQVAVVGRLVASFEPHTSASWNRATPELLEFGLHAGTLAVRYDRRPEDPVLQIRTRDALVRVLGTVFTVHVDEGGTTVAVLRGRVEVLDPATGRWQGEVEAGFRFDVRDFTYRDVSRREVAAALALAEQDEGVGESALGQIPQAWTVPGLSGDPEQRTLDRVFLDEVDTQRMVSDMLAQDRAGGRRSKPKPGLRGAAPEFAGIDTSLLDDIEDAAREHKLKIAAEFERCRALYDDGHKRFGAGRCLSDFVDTYDREPEAVEGLLLLGILRMDFAHDYQSATRNIEEFLRRDPDHPKAELARYRLMLAAIDAGYINRGLAQARIYLRDYPDGQSIGQILQRFPELKSEL